MFDDDNHFRRVLENYVIQEGFQFQRVKNEGAKWRIHASHLPDGRTFKMKTYQKGT